jgi:hypothetical protein
VLDEGFENKIASDDEASTERKLSVAALFEQGGDIAPVDIRLFGARVGEIISRGAGVAGREQRRRRLGRAGR